MGKHYIRGSDEYEDRLFWIAKMYPHHHRGRSLRGTANLFLVENVHPRDRMIDVLLLLRGRLVADRGDIIQFHHKETFVRTKGTKIIELKEQRVRPNKIKLVYSDAWIAKLKAWVDNNPDQRVLDKMLSQG
ncbi:hypothetical protein P9112_002965 [Eukaryota sp. TZLM1-RC]